jgi:hypothetical protein
VIGHLNTPFSAANRSSSKEISKERTELNYSLCKNDITDIYRISHPTDTTYYIIYTIFLSWIGHRLATKSLKKPNI